LPADAIFLPSLRLLNLVVAEVNVLGAVLEELVQLDGVVFLHRLVLEVVNSSSFGLVVVRRVVRLHLRTSFL
jgi:hypothetical protein